MTSTGKPATQAFFDRELQHLALQLLRALLRLALRIGELRTQVIELLLQLRLAQLRAVRLLRTHRGLTLRDEVIHLLLHLERERLLFVLQLLPLFTQRHLLGAQLRDLGGLRRELLLPAFALGGHHLCCARRRRFRDAGLDRLLARGERRLALIHLRELDLAVRELRFQRVELGPHRLFRQLAHFGE
jgi:hypothetical protein